MKVRIEFEDGDQSFLKSAEISHQAVSAHDLSIVVEKLLRSTDFVGGVVIAHVVNSMFNADYDAFRVFINNVEYGALNTISQEVPDKNWRPPTVGIVGQ